LPRGGPLQLDEALRLPAVLTVAPPFLELVVEPTTRTFLGSAALGLAASLEILLGDRVRLEEPTGPSTTLEFLR
jgi:hypothetical protein